MRTRIPAPSPSQGRRAPRGARKLDRWARAGLFLALAASALAVSPGVHAASSNPIGDGDDAIVWIMVDETQLQYSATELLDFLEAHFPNEDIAGLRSAVEDDKDVKITEVTGGTANPSIHDKTTIAVNSDKFPLWVCALGVLHEWWHIGHIPAEKGPYEQDPETDADNPCGSCNHLAGLLDQMKHISYLSCEGVVTSAEACSIWKQARDAAARVYYDCVYEGPSCSSYSGSFIQVLTAEQIPCNCN